MFKDEQLRSAEAALEPRYVEPARAGMQPSQFLTCRRAADLGDSVRVILNRMHEQPVQGSPDPPGTQRSPGTRSATDLR
jgi:hypothetical protein